MMKNNIRIYVLALGLMSLGVLHSCSESKSGETEEAKNMPKPVETFVLSKAKMATELRLPGELIAYQQVDLYAKVNSFVKDLKVDIGSQVKAGQLLIELEAPEIASQLLAAESRLKAQEAIYTASKANYDRILATSKTAGTISQNELDQALAKMNADLAQLEAAKASQKEFSTMKSYLEIRAPFNGVITNRNVNLGAYVGPSGKGSEMPLLTLQEQSQLRLVVSIPEANIQQLQAGSEVAFTVRSLPNETFHAEVKRLAGALDTRLRAERVEMDVYNKKNTLLPGMIAEVNIPLGNSDSSFVVPKTAFVESAEGNFVVKVVDNKTARVAVQKGRVSGESVEVFGNLNENDILVTKASEELRDGTVITK